MIDRILRISFFTCFIILFGITNSTFLKAVTVTADTISPSSTGTKTTVSKDLFVTKNLSVTGNTTKTGTLTVVGATTLSSLTVNGVSNFKDNITLTAGKTFTGNVSGNADTATDATHAASSDTSTEAEHAISADSATIADSATNFTGSLSGDVVGTQEATVVSFVGEASAENVASGVNAANTATNENIPNSIIKRDANGNFSAGTITAYLNGNAATATDAVNAEKAASFTGETLNVSGELTVGDNAIINNNLISHGNLSIDGNTSLSGTLSVLGNAELVGNVSVRGNNSVDGNFNVSEITQLNSLEALGDASIDGSLTVGGVANFNEQINLADGKTIVGNVTGNADSATEAVHAITSNSSTSFTGQLSGDVSGQQNETVVEFIGEVSAANVALGSIKANAATNLNTANAIVKRDINGDFTARTITASLEGNAASSTVAESASVFTGSLSGDVVGTQDATIVSFVGEVSAEDIASGANAANAATKENTPNTIIKRDVDGNFSAGNITANLLGLASFANHATQADTSSTATYAARATNANHAILSDATTNFVGTNLDIPGYLEVAGDAIFSNLSTSDLATLDSLIVTEDAIIKTGLDVKKSTTLEGTIDVYKNTILHQALNVYGPTNFYNTVYTEPLIPLTQMSMADTTASEFVAWSPNWTVDNGGFIVAVNNVYQTNAIQTFSVNSSGIISSQISTQNTLYTPNCVAWSPNGNFIAVASDSGIGSAVQIFGINSYGNISAQISSQSFSDTIINAILWAPSWSPTTGGFVIVAFHTVIKTYGVDASGNISSVISSRSTPTLTKAMAWSPNWSPSTGGPIVVGSEQSIKIFQVNSSGIISTETSSYPAVNDIRSIAWSPNGEFIASAEYAAGAIKIFRTNETGTILSITSSLLSGGGVNSIKWLPSWSSSDGGFVCVSCIESNTLQVFNINRNGRILKTEFAYANTMGSPYCVDWSPQGNFMAVANSNSYSSIQTFKFNL